MSTAKFKADEANPSWWPRVLDVLARDYPETNEDYAERVNAERAAFGLSPLAAGTETTDA